MTAFRSLAETLADLDPGDGWSYDALDTVNEHRKEIVAALRLAEVMVERFQSFDLDADQDTRDAIWPLFYAYRDAREAAK